MEEAPQLEPSGARGPEKSTWIAILLNLLSPYGGHLYASDGREGTERFIVAVVLALLTPLLILTAIPWMYLWASSLRSSTKTTRKYSPLQNQVEVGERVVAPGQQGRPETRISGEELASALKKIQDLQTKTILSTEEAAQERRKILSECQQRWTDENLPTFLSPFSPLLESGTMSAEDLEMVKGLYQEIQRG